MKEVFHLRGESHKFPILALIYDNLFQRLLGKLTLYLSLSEFKKATKKQKPSNRPCRICNTYISQVGFPQRKCVFPLRKVGQFSLVSVFPENKRKESLASVLVREIPGRSRPVYWHTLKYPLLLFLNWVFSFYVVFTIWRQLTLISTPLLYFKQLFLWRCP